MTNAIMSITTILAHTPFWVWIILALLIWRGLKSTMPREVGLTSLLLLPAALVLLSAYNIFSGGLTMAVVAGLAMGALLGIAAGLQLERRFAAVPVGPGRLLLPGEWTSLGVVLTVFATRYIKIVAGIVNPALAANGTFVLVMTGISAFTVAMLLTRTASRFRVMQGAAQPMLVQ
ncbi:DUF6622 family protein [Devosia sp.]|uniref:DUF6622 family protein n=1 Tax=Devosia sp. TaxID=1871048 RepID=UPI003262E748